MSVNASRVVVGSDRRRVTSRRSRVGESVAPGTKQGTDGGIRFSRIEGRVACKGGPACDLALYHKISQRLSARGTRTVVDG